MIIWRGGDSTWISTKLPAEDDMDDPRSMVERQAEVVAVVATIYESAYELARGY